MKPWRLALAVAMAAFAVMLLTSIVAAAPTSTSGVQTNQVFDSPILTGTMPMTHPVGIMIAMYFNIPYTQVMTLHNEGWGFGEIARAYLTALHSNGVLTPEQVLALRQDGIGWGQIKKEFGINPGQNGLGVIMRSKPITPTVTLEPPTNNNQGKDNNCPGNSCNAPGQNKPDNGPKFDMPKGPKWDTPKGPKHK